MQSSVASVQDVKMLKASGSSERDQYQYEMINNFLAENEGVIHVDCTGKFCKTYIFAALKSSRVCSSTKVPNMNDSFFTSSKNSLRGKWKKHSH